MVEVSWFSIAIDVGLLCSLVVFGLRMVKSSGPRVNLGRLTELETSLRALLGEADSASRALSDHLVKRQKDLEKLLFDLESTNGKLNRQVTAAEDVRGQLEIQTARALSSARLVNERVSVAQEGRSRVSANPTVEEGSFDRRPSAPIELSDSLSGVEMPSAPLDERPPRMSHFQEAEIEPPSFQSVKVAPTAKRARIAPPEPIAHSTHPSLEEQVEREVILESPSKPIRQSPVQRRPSAVERALAHQRQKSALTVSDDTNPSMAASSDVRSLARRLAENEALRERNSISPGVPVPEVTKASQFMAEDEDRSAVLSPEEAARASGEDPRLGVLGGAPIRRQVQVL